MQLKLGCQNYNFFLWEKVMSQKCNYEREPGPNWNYYGLLVNDCAISQAL